MNPIAFADSHPGCSRNSKVRVRARCLSALPAMSALLSALPAFLLPLLPLLSFAQRTHDAVCRAVVLLGVLPTQGQRVLPNCVCWQQHLLVLMVSAKLLADAEAAMQASSDSSSSSKRAAAGGGGAGGGGGGLDPSSMRQLMGRPEGPPVRYLMTLLTGFTQPLTYPDHGAIMELRSAQQR